MDNCAEEERAALSAVFAGGGVYDCGSVALMEGSSAISKRAWGILEKHFRDWAARICVSAGAKI